jgi:hypothetical protein
MSENTSFTGTSAPIPPEKQPGDIITPDTFQQMLTILESMVDHTHIAYDNYSTVCQCQCQCACRRGIV